MEHDTPKFAPAQTCALDAPKQESFRPTRTAVDVLGVHGTGTVIDYGAGTGKLAAAVAQIPPQGRMVAVDESKELLACKGPDGVDVWGGLLARVNAGLTAEISAGPRTPHSRRAK